MLKLLFLVFIANDIVIYGIFLGFFHLILFSNKLPRSIYTFAVLVLTAI